MMMMNPRTAVTAAVVLMGAIATERIAPAQQPAQVVLSGTWELKADDGRSGVIVLRPDGTLTASSSSGDVALPDYHGHWFILANNGVRYHLEFAKERGEAAAYQVTLLLTCSDAFTVVETIKGGVPIRDQQRFVRVAPFAAGPGR